MSENVQYIERRSVHREILNTLGVFSTPEGYNDYTTGPTMMSVGDNGITDTGKLFHSPGQNN